MIIYTESLAELKPGMLIGFWQKWDQKPSPETTFRLLKQSSAKIVALDQETNQAVGFITALTDNVMSAYIPFVEVLPEYQGRGVGQELIKRMSRKFEHLFMLDLICDESLQSYYEKLGMVKAVGMSVRHHEREAGN